MRLEVFCKDRPGLTGELLNLLVLRDIDLRGFETGNAGRVYLNLPALDFNIFRRLMTEIRRISGVTDVRTLAYMPTEWEHCALKTLLTSMQDPIFSLNLKGGVELANSAALALFASGKEKISHKIPGSLLSGYNFSRWIEGANSAHYSEKTLILGQDYLMDIIPIDNQDENQQNCTIGAVVILKSMVPIDQQLQDLSVNNDDKLTRIIAVSPQMRQVVEQVHKLAMLDAPLLLTGDTGTGKDLLAMTCHLHSQRAKQPFLGFNCASLPDEVIESELFGYAAGAHPNTTEGKKGLFEQANGGSVLLDEIGEMSPRMQIKLLCFLNEGSFRRVGEEREVRVNVRIMGVTQKNLLELVRRGAFREDLYYRLNVLTITLPPLRERQADIMPLVEHFVTHFAREQGLTQPALTADLFGLLTKYDWPGNVRQLKNTIYCALTQLNGRELRAQHIALPDIEATVSDDMLNGSLDDISKRFERLVLMRLYRHYPSTRKLAKRLGVSHTAIANKLREHGLGGQRALSVNE